MRTEPANIRLVLDDKGNKVGMIMGPHTYRLEAPLQDEEIAEVLMNGGDALPLIPQIIREEVTAKL